jgi:hypothetical protein
MEPGQVNRTIEALPGDLRETLNELADAPWETVEAVFGLLPYDQRTAATTLELAEPGELVDPETGIRPLVPTPLARGVLAKLVAPAPDMTLETFRLRAKELIDRIPQELQQLPPAAASPHTTRA